MNLTELSDEELRQRYEESHDETYHDDCEVCEENRNLGKEIIRRFMGQPEQGNKSLDAPSR
jgi:hypothetical protein